MTKRADHWLLEKQKKGIIFGYWRMLCLLLFILVPAKASWATIPSKIENPDPVQTGEVCNNWTYYAYGGYIFYVRSRIDLIFEFELNPMFHWTCKVSGYASLTSVFSTVTPAEVIRIQTYLSKNYDGEVPKGDALLDHMQAIYELRDMSDWFWGIFYRVRAWDQEDDIKRNYRLLAARHLKKALANENLEHSQRVEALYILGRFEWLYGDKAKARKYFKKAKSWDLVDWKRVHRREHRMVKELIAFHEAGLADGKGTGIIKYIRGLEK